MWGQWSTYQQEAKAGIFTVSIDPMLLVSKLRTVMSVDTWGETGKRP